MLHKYAYIIYNTKARVLRCIYLIIWPVLYIIQSINQSIHLYFRREPQLQAYYGLLYTERMTETLNVTEI